MRQMRKRALALLCCLCLFLAGLPLGAQAAGAPFRDVQEGDWMYNAVEYVRQHGLMSGTGSGATFSPNATLTRSMFVTILGRLAGVDKQNYPGASFSDVRAGEWYAPYVEWASRKGVTSGVGNGLFGVDNAITRQEMASMVNRYLDIEGLALAQAPDVLPRFTDSDDIAFWAAQDAEALRKTGLFKGNDKGQFLPTKSALRSEAAVVFTSLHQAVQAALAAEPEVFYSISGIACEGGEASVTVSTARSAWVSLRILSEDKSRVLAQGQARVKGGLSMEPVQVELSNSLPSYFVAQADLLDDGGAPLCDTYTYMGSTQAYERFQALTTADFPEEKVLDLDGEADNNFLVVADSVALVGGGDGAVVQPAPDGRYTITGAGDVAPGGRLVVQDGEETLLLVVESAEEGVLVAGADPAPDFAAYFDCAKIDTQISGTPSVQQPAAAQARGLLDWHIDPVQLGEIDVDKEGALPIYLHFGANSGPLSLDVDATCTLRVHFTLQYSLILFGRDYVFCELSTSIEQHTNATVGLKAEHDGSNDEAIDEVDLANLLVPLGAPGLAAKVSVTAPVDWNLKGGLHVDMDSTVTGGFQFCKSEEGEQGLHPFARNDSSATADLEAEGSIKFGPKLAVGITYLGDVFKGEVNLFAGLLLRGTAAHPLGSVSTVSQAGAHACQLCVDGEVDTQVSVGAKAELNLGKWFAATLLDGDIPIKDEHLLDFYLSLQNDGESVHGGAVTFGLDDCPNYIWRVDFPVTDSTGKAINATVSTPGAKIPGKNRGYYYPGDYTASVTVEGKEYTKSFTVSSGPQAVPFVVAPAYLEEYARILREAAGNAPSSWKPSFALAYIDNDDIPELLVCGSGSHVSLTDIYFYKNGKVVKQEMGTAYGTFRFSPRTGMLWRWDLSSGYESQSFGTLGASGYQSTIYFSSNGGAVANASDIKYWIREQEVSESRYDRELKKAQDAYKWVQFAYGSSTDSFRASSSNINGMLENPQQYVLSKTYTLK